MNSELISVIVPVYNTQNYINRCIESLEKQDYKNIEIIIVNDGSTDKSIDICEKLVQKYNNITLINKKNEGSSSARNTGIKSAHGKYIAFVDSDDWVEADIYSYMLKLIDRYHVDLVDVMVKQVKNKRSIVENQKEKIEIYKNDEILEHYLYRGMNEKNGAPYSSCRKLYQASLFSDDCKFSDGIVNEDICLNYQILQRCKSIAVSNQIKYFYFQRKNSITNGVVKEKDFVLLDVTNKLIELAKESNNYRIIELAKMKAARSDFSLLARIAIDGIDDSVRDADEIINCLKRRLKKNIGLIWKSPMSLLRKILCIAFVINYNLSRKFIGIVYNNR